MKKKISMVLVLCMMLNLLPVSAMTSEGDAITGAWAEIIGFEPLDQEETEKTVAVGTPTEALGLPKTLRATVKTIGDGEPEDLDAPDSGAVGEEEAAPVESTPEITEPSLEEEDSLEDSPLVEEAEGELDGGTLEAEEIIDDEEVSDDEGVAMEEGFDPEEATEEKPVVVEKIISCDIPVTWTSAPTYNMERPGVYVFIPVIEEYILGEEVVLPQITVTVEAPVMPMMMLSMGSPVEVSSFDELKTALNQATGPLELVLTNNISNTTLQALKIAETNPYDITIDLNGKKLSGGSVKALIHQGTGTLTIKDSIGTGSVTTSALYTIEVSNDLDESGTLEIYGSTVENSHTSGYAIYVRKGTANIYGGTIRGYRAIVATSGSTINIHDGTTVNASLYGICAYDPGTKLTIYDGNISGTGGALFTEFGDVTVIDGQLTSEEEPTIYVDSGSLKVLGGTIQNEGTNSAIYQWNAAKSPLGEGQLPVKTQIQTVERLLI